MNIKNVPTITNNTDTTCINNNFSPKNKFDNIIPKTVIDEKIIVKALIEQLLCL